MLRLVNPVGNEKVVVVGIVIVAHGREDKFLSIRREDGKGIEHFVISDLFEAGSIKVYHEKIEG